MRKIIHLSDLHIGYKNLDTVCRSVFDHIINTREPDRYVIVITGDLVDKFTKKNIKTTKSLLEMLKDFQVLLIPGNHDYGTGSINLEENVAKFKKEFFNDSTVTYPKKDIIDNIAFLGLDSSASQVRPPENKHADGELGDIQLFGERGLSYYLLEDPEVLACDKKVVYLHHHPFHCFPYHGLIDTDKLKLVVKNRVDALLFGHNHMAFKFNGWWKIPYCYDAGSTTGKRMPLKGPTRVIDLYDINKPHYNADFGGYMPLDKMPDFDIYARDYY